MIQRKVAGNWFYRECGGYPETLSSICDRPISSSPLIKVQGFDFLLASRPRRQSYSLLELPALLPLLAALPVSIPAAPPIHYRPPCRPGGAEMFPPLLLIFYPDSFKTNLLWISLISEDIKPSRRKGGGGGGGSVNVVYSVFLSLLEE